MGQFQCKSLHMLCEASVLVKRAAEPCPVGDRVKSAIARAAKRLGWDYSRTKNIWHGRARRIDAAEMDTLRAAAKEAQAAIDRLLALRNALTEKDADFYCQEIVALECALRRMGCNLGAGGVRRTAYGADETQ